jgi:hypothetical protein
VHRRHQNLISSKRRRVNPSPEVIDTDLSTVTAEADKV